MTPIRIKIEQRTVKLWRDIHVTFVVACAYTAGDDRPILELSLREMAAWLDGQGYRWVTGSNGYYAKEEAA